MLYRSKLAVAFLGLTLTACGGGGGNASSNSADMPKQPGSLPSYQLTVAEMSTEARDLSQKLGDLSGSLFSELSVVSGSVSNGTLQIASVEVDRPTAETVYVLDDSGKRIAELNILVTNTSASMVETKIGVVGAGNNSLLSLPELKGLHRIVIDTAYLTGNVTAAQQKSMITEFDTSKLPSFRQTETALQTLMSKFELYQQGKVGEGALMSLTEVATAALDRLAQEGFSLVSSRAQFVRSPLAIPTTYDLTFNEPGKSISRFVGNTALGNWTGDKWTYSTTYDHLSLIQ